MIRQRVRIRFRKEGDLRLIGHRDLLRTVERSFRRAGVQLRLSEGFHPKAKLSFPLALAVGIVGSQEVMEVEFSEEVQTESLTELLRSVFPPGLVLDELELLPEGTPKAQVARIVYGISVPTQLHESTRRAIEALMAKEECWIERKGRSKPIDLRANLEALELIDGTLRIEQSTSRTASASPREVLQQLELGHIELEGKLLTRTHVNLVAPKP